eukprot:2446592-Pyramimonas_sp.AAC.1
MSDASGRLETHMFGDLPECGDKQVPPESLLCNWGLGGKLGSGIFLDQFALILPDKLFRGPTRGKFNLPVLSKGASGKQGRATWQAKS